MSLRSLQIGGGGVTSSKIINRTTPVLFLFYFYIFLCIYYVSQLRYDNSLINDDHKQMTMMNTEKLTITE